MTDIPKTIQVHLNEIAERLNQGKATVMVGAGFSKNAVKIKNTDKKFLSWNELADLFYEKLNGEKPDEKTGHYLDALRLAENVESTLGRPTLDRILLDNLPDDEYEPSDLHKELLKLNWADVFTTNYDTLLERTRKYITNRKYHVVMSKNDLVYSQCPRIIKLHGSFPSERPFIISQEDYRKYPKDSAAFVNTVQQALLENIMCLIGFSGDDPNFLNWLGWIRDNLGRNTPKIYFISLDLFPRIDTALLESRNIVIINMAECFSKGEKADTGKLYKDALNLFINEIQTCHRVMDKKWLPRRQTYGQIKEIVEKEKDETKKKEQLNNLYKLWKDSMQCYPGWIIMPYKFRCKFVNSIGDFECYLRAYHDTVAQNDNAIFLDFLKVYDWIRQVCLLPITKKMFCLYDEAICRVSPNDCSFLELKLSLLEYYRRNGMFDKHSQMLDKLKNCSNIPDEQRIRVDCESAYAALYRFDFELLEKMLDQSTDSLNYDMELLYIGLLWECNRYEQVHIRLVNALDKIRCTETSRLNIKAFSQEAYIINLFGIMTRMYNYAAKDNQSNEEFTKEVIKVFSEYESQCYGLGNRRDFLKLYDCNPENEIELFQQILVRQKYVGTDETEDYEKSVQFIDFIEHTGMCMVIDTGNEYYAQLRNAIKSISKKHLYWGIALSVRTREESLIQYVLTNGATTTCSVQEINDIAGIALEWVKKYYNRINGDVETTEVPHKLMVWGTYMPQVLSILTWYVSSETRQKIFDQILEISDHKGHSLEFGILVKEILSSFDDSEIKKNLDKILTLFVDSSKCVLLHCITGCDMMFYMKASNINLNKTEFLKKLRFLKNNNKGNNKNNVGIMYRIALLYHFGVLSTSEINWFQSSLMTDLNNEVSYPLEMYYYIYNLIPTEDEIKDKIQRDVVVQLNEALRTTNKTTDFYRFVRKFELVSETYHFIWHIEIVENIMNMLEQMNKETVDHYIKYSYFYQIFIYVLCNADIDHANLFAFCERHMKQNGFAYGGELIDSEKKYEYVIERISGKDRTDLMEAIGLFYMEIKDNFNFWKDYLDQVVLILCMTAKRDLTQATFCVSMIRKILKNSNEVYNQFTLKQITTLLKYFFKLPICSNEVLLAKAESAKLAYDLSKLRTNINAVLDIVKQWENLCKEEDTAALIRKQWYDCTY